MSEAAETVETPPQVSLEDLMAPTRQPFDLDDALQAKVRSLGLEETLRSLRQEGYGYVDEVADLDFNARLRETILRVCREGGIGSVAGSGASMLLDKDPIFADVVLNPKLLAVAEVMCGKGAMISQVAASVKPEGGAAAGLHADQNWMPAPFPVHNQLVTFCWATDAYNEANGSTKVVPKSHLHARHPTMQEIRDEPEAIATECPAGTAVVWGGSNWHGQLSTHLARRTRGPARDVQPPGLAAGRVL